MDWASLKRGLAEDIVKRLFKLNAILFGEFTLTSGLKSPYYIDLRVIPSYPDDFIRVCDAYYEILANEVGSFDRIAGVPTAGIPFATMLAYRFRKPLIYVRKEVERGHGRGRIVEGVLNVNDRVVIIDDVATTGESLMLTAQSIISMGGRVEDAVVLVDREQGAEAKLMKMGIKLHSLIKISDAARILLDHGLISGELYNKILSYVRGVG
ncbi:orotate phosphoribosyltransferase [Candidatus Culexarchaeum yellowstonense]|uniref:orotate phosphoribosyltransferase n=1 Tax=Candidatus Culexarchaeum yellowstonense TaxID=2928963 RepID=UPI0026F00E9B|nr:orotate phosphoribosyltransferase [Candidatus Culexarchaeum yellowstonense]